MHNATVTYMQADDTCMIINKLAIAFLHTLTLLDVTVPPQFFRQFETISTIIWMVVDTHRLVRLHCTLPEVILVLSFCHQHW